MMIDMNRMIFAATLCALVLCVEGCAPKVVMRFRYVDNQEPVVQANVTIRPHLTFANPLLPFKTKKVTTSSNGEIELSLDCDPDSEAKNIELSGPDGSFHEWSMGKKDRVTRYLVEHWIGEQGKWVTGYTDTRRQGSVEAILIQK